MLFNKMFISNIIFMILAINIFIHAPNFKVGAILFLILALLLVIFRLFFTESGKYSVDQIKLTVENFKLEKKIKNDSKSKQSSFGRRHENVSKRNTSEDKEE